MRRTEASTLLTLFVNFVCSSAKRTPTQLRRYRLHPFKCSANLMDIQESTSPLNSPLYLCEPTMCKLAPLP